MKKKIFLTLVFVLSIFLVTACNEKKGLAFKEDYEKLNNQTNSTGKPHRNLSINENNPFVEISLDDVIAKMNNNETFYVYFGSTLCPWCRSTIEQAVKVAMEKNIKTVYYVDIWDDNGNEVFRDKYTYANNLANLVNEGSENYKVLLDKAQEFLQDYELIAENGDKTIMGEKRIYGSDYLYIENGEVKKYTNGKSDKQTDSRQELSDEIKNDEYNKFSEFFSN